MTYTLPMGVIAPILTPFNDDLSIVEDLYVALAKALLADGCAALAPFGTTGEALSVGSDERVAALKGLVAAGVDPARLIPGTGLTNLPETAALSRACLDLGCPAVMTLPPFYYKVATEDGLYAYFRELIARIDHPETRLVLYHIPQVAGVGLPVSLVARLKADFRDQIIGVKDSSGDLENTLALLKIDGLTVYPGAETPLPQTLAAGGSGCISATANLNAGPLAATVAALAAGDADALAQFEAVKATRLTIQGYDFIPTQKRLLAMATGDPRWATVRPPFLPADEARARALLAELSEGFAAQLKTMAARLQG